MGLRHCRAASFAKVEGVTTVPSARRKTLHDDCAIGIRQPRQIVDVHCEDHPAAGLDGGSDHMGVRKVFRTRPSRRKHSTDQTREHSVGIAQLQGFCLARQQRIDHLIPA